MPGSSLWLLPPATNAQDPLVALIEKTSSHFGSPHRFLPHITLTSELSPSLYGSNPQAWLDSLKFPSGDEIEVKYQKLDSEDVFFRKLYIKCEKRDGLKKLATQCRQHVKGSDEENKAKEWANESYNPHMSLLYHDCPEVDAEGLLKVGHFVKDLGIDLHGENGWKGGRVVLVPTDKSIDQWAPIAERTL